MESYNFEGLHQLHEGTWGIPEPVQGVPTQTDRIDVVLVPLVAVDLKGHRVGYGKGHYDRFLSSCRPDCKKIGLSFFPAVQTIDNVEKHDVRLTAIIEPGGYQEVMNSYG